jgi:hypothetical protein
MKTYFFPIFRKINSWADWEKYQLVDFIFDYLNGRMTVNNDDGKD